MKRSEAFRAIDNKESTFHGGRCIEPENIHDVLDALESAGMQFDPEEPSAVEKWKRETELPEMCSEHCNAEYYVGLGNAMHDELQAAIADLKISHEKELRILAEDLYHWVPNDDDNTPGKEATIRQFIAHAKRKIKEQTP